MCAGKMVLEAWVWCFNQEMQDGSFGVKALQSLLAEHWGWDWRGCDQSPKGIYHTAHEGPHLCQVCTPEPGWRWALLSGHQVNQDNMGMKGVAPVERWMLRGQHLGTPNHWSFSHFPNSLGCLQEGSLHKQEFRLSRYYLVSAGFSHSNLAAAGIPQL